MAHCCVNGASEMVTNLSMGITTFLFNMAMLHYLGENGVAAITIVLYAQFLMVSIFLGFTSGVRRSSASTMGRKLGARAPDHPLLLHLSHRLFHHYTGAVHSLCAIPDGHLFTGGHGGIRFGAAWLLSFRGKLFAGWDQHLCLRHVHAFSNGLISGLLSLLRTLVFVVLGIVLLPSFLGLDGVWLTIPAAELGAIIFSLFFTWKYRNRYGYGAGAERLKKEKEDLQSLQEA